MVIVILAIIIAVVYFLTKEKPDEDIPEFKSQYEFIEWFKKKVEYMKEMNVDTRAVIAQAALETGWGKHIPKDTQTGKISQNFFGIKWYPGWPSDYVTCITKEYDSKTGKYYEVTSQFRAYKTVKEGLDDYLSLVQRKYPKAWENRSNYELYVKEIANGGWATSPTYVSSILSIIKTYLT